jgi:hypothetical protein
MDRRMALTVAGLAMGVAAAVSCRRIDPRVAVVEAPQMADERAIRIVTNAALDEVVAPYDGIEHDFEVDLSRKVVLYHEGPRLLSAAYQRRIEARIAEVGFPGRVAEVRPNPPAPTRTDRGIVQNWPNRHTAVLVVPGLRDNTDANVVVDAIAYARLGSDDPRVAIHRPTRRLVVSYDSMRLSLKSLEHAIACAGFDANDTPARLGRTDSPPHGWSPIRL